MKTKPILIIAAIVIVAVSAFFLFHKKKTVVNSEEVSQFLYKFNNGVLEGNVDSLTACFESDKKTKSIKNFINLLAGKKDKDGAKPLASIKLIIDKADIKSNGDDLLTVTIPAEFDYQSFYTKQSTLKLKIRKTGNQLKIIQADARLFMTDYLAYENDIHNSIEAEKVTYSDITLASFKTAEQLKTRYDSVIWFAHLNNKNYFYVIKGKWNSYKDIYRKKDSVIEPYKMGLVNPDLKEIIPIEYDLIHNINATFDGLVEVEKDNKKGFYNLDGKLVIPVNYDQIFPIEDDANLAVLRNGNDYFYLKKDTTISEKVSLKVGDFASKIAGLNNPLDLYDNAIKIVTEYNSKEYHSAVYIAPSYLVDMNIIPKDLDFKNPLRNSNDEDVHKNYEVKHLQTDKTTDNWFEDAFYSVRDYFLGGRSEFYDKKNLVIVDKKQNRILTYDIPTDESREEGGDGSLEGICDINSLRAINDSLFEVKSGATFDVELYDSTKDVTGGPYYHYLVIKNNKLQELKNDRNFGFTKYVKLDDSYLNGCYEMMVGAWRFDKRTKKVVNHITPEMLSYMKNEIYADYRYQFKDKRWQNIFQMMNSYYSDGSNDKPNNISVDDSLTEIDKYNINWINQKLKEASYKPQKSSTLASR